MIARLLWILSGAVVGILFTVAVAWTAGALFGPLYRNDNDMNRNAVIFLGACIVLMVVGALIGNYIHKKNITRRST